MEPDDFLVWCLDQEDRYELVGGHPIRMMTRATQGHDDLTVNLIAGLRQRLKPPCRVHTADLASRMEAGAIRRPDVTIECGRGDKRGLNTVDPTVFFEVLSPSTRQFDLLKKPEEYKRLPTLRHIVMLDPDLPRAWVLSRTPDGWGSGVDVHGLDGIVDLPGVDSSLPMAEIYDGVELENTWT